MFESLKTLAGYLPLARILRPGDRAAVVILMYHDICPDGDTPNWLRVPERRFAAQLAALAKIGTFIGPTDLERPGQLSRDRLSFLVTFDDGYHYNLELAAPILESRGIPALYFISTGPMVSRRPFWTDIVVNPIQQLRLAALDLGAHGLHSYRFRSSDAVQRWSDVQRLLVDIKNVGNEDHPRVAGILEWFQDEYRQVLADCLPRYAPISTEELATLASTEHAHVGSHGHEHRIFSKMSREDLKDSVQVSRRTLESLTGQSIDDIAYPNGDYNSDVIATAESCGYRRGYTVRGSTLDGTVPAMELPRLAIGAFDSPALLRWKIFKLLTRMQRQQSVDLRLLRTNVTPAGVDRSSA